MDIDDIVPVPPGLCAGLVDFPWTPRTIEVPVVPGSARTLGLRCIDEGPRDAHAVVFLHGNPSWSFIWRSSIAAVLAAGYRAVSLDLCGMGLSDRPARIVDYTVERHVAWTTAALIDVLGLSDFTLVLHDWGGIIGMRIAADHPDRVAGMSISNTGLPSRDPDEPLPEDSSTPRGAFAGFQKFAREVPAWEPWTMLEGMMVTPVRDEVRAGYRAPYPDQSHTVGSRAFTQLLPTTPDNPMLVPNWHAWRVLENWHKPVVTIFSDKDIVAPKGWVDIVARIPGAAGQPHVVLEGGGHFLQEDIPEAFNAALVSWLTSLWPARGAHDSQSSNNSGQ